MKSKFILTIFLIFLVLLSGCVSQNDIQDENQETNLSDNSKEKTNENSLFENETIESKSNFKEVLNENNNFEMKPEDCLDGELYDEIEKVCYIECDSEEDCNKKQEELLKQMNDKNISTDDFDFFGSEILVEMKPEDCLDGELFDEIEKVCYIECETEEECLKIENEIMQKAGEIGEDYFEGDQNFEEPVEQEMITLAVYNIKGKEIIESEKPTVSAELASFQNDSEKHKIIWNKFSNLVPLSSIPFLEKFEIATDEKEGTYAMVYKEDHDQTKWRLIVDIKDSFNENGEIDSDLTYTLIHEYGHMITLNKSQVILAEKILGKDFSGDVTGLKGKCKFLMLPEGCAKEKSYVNSFYEKYWKNIFDEHNNLALIEDENEYYEAETKFFDKYSNQFVTNYAATNLGEDIAESFTSFVLKEKPEGNSIADQKIKFFYNYSELVKLRNTIRKRL